MLFTHLCSLRGSKFVSECDDLVAEVYVEQGRLRRLDVVEPLRRFRGFRCVLNKVSLHCIEINAWLLCLILK